MIITWENEYYTDPWGIFQGEYVSNNILSKLASGNVYISYVSAFQWLTHIVDGAEVVRFKHDKACHFLGDVVSNEGFYSMGLGVLGETNTEYIQMYHTGTYSIINSGKTGTGSLRKMSHQMSSTEVFSIETDAKFKINSNQIEDSGNANVFTFDGSQNVTAMGTVTTSKGRIKNIDRHTANHTILVSEEELFGNTDGGAFTYTLPAGVAGQHYRIINTGTSGNLLTIAPNGAEHLIGVNSSFTLVDGESIIISYNATDGWY